MKPSNVGCVALTAMVVACAGDSTRDSSQTDSIARIVPDSAEQTDTVTLQPLPQQTATQSALLDITVPDVQYRYSTEGGCEGFGCTCDYGMWLATDTLPVYRNEGDTSEVVLVLLPGDSVLGHEGFFHVIQPGIVVVEDTVRQDFKVRPDDPDYVFVPGDTVYVYRHTGEGYHVVWYDGELASGAQAFWSGDPRIRLRAPKGRMLRPPETLWWASVTVGAVEGWLRGITAGQLEGPHARCLR